MTKTILAPTATAAERAIDQASAETLDALPVNLIRWTKNPDLCPVELLPWLAWERGVDTWNTNWTEQEKRDAIKRAPFIHRHRGTVAAVRRALVDSPFGTDIVQWFEQEPPGDPYTFVLNVEQQDLPVSDLDHQDLKHAVMRAKNLRSWFSVNIFGRKEGTVYAAGYLFGSEVITTKIIPTAIILEPSDLEMKPGGTEIVNVTIIPVRSEDKRFTAVSSDESIATVEVVNGQLVVTSHSNGNATITVSAVSGSATATLPVIVSAVIDVTMNVTNTTTRPLFWLLDPTETIKVTIDGDEMPITVGETGQVLPANTLANGDHRIVISGGNSVSFFNGAVVVNRLTQIHEFGGSRASMYTVFQNHTLLHTIDEGAFDYLQGVTDFSYAFYGCTSLASVPSDLFSRQTEITTMSAIFYNCRSLTSIPDGFFDGLSNVLNYMNVFAECYNLAIIPDRLFADSPLATVFTLAFSSCNKLAAIPANLFANSINATSMDGTFNSCSSITSVPAGLFQNCAAATNFDSVFSNCTALQTIPDDLFAHCLQATRFNSSFRNSGLTEIPPALFANNTKALSFSTVFSLCNFLTVVPQGIFDACTRATVFEGAFQACVDINSVPENLFSATHAENIAAVFYGCVSLETIPATLFSGCNYVTAFSQAFLGCASLQAIPSGLLDDMTSVLSMNQSFSNCSALTELPDNLLDNCTLATSMVSTFSGCSQLETLPENLFAFTSNVSTVQAIFTTCRALTSVPGNLFSGLSAVTNFSQVFGSCVSLTQVGEGLFDNCTSMQNISYIFQSCTNLASLPPGLFAMTTLTNCADAFNPCRKLTSDPNDIFSAESYPTMKALQRIFYNCDKITGSGNDFIARFPAATTTSDALNKCTSLDDYASLPASWL